LRPFANAVTAGRGSKGKGERSEPAALTLVLGGRVRHSVRCQVQATFLLHSQRAPGPVPKQDAGPGDTNLSMPPPQLRPPESRRAAPRQESPSPRSSKQNKLYCGWGWRRHQNTGAAALAPARTNLAKPAYRSYAREELEPRHAEDLKERRRSRKLKLILVVVRGAPF
jgi:hypothetical protein